MKVLKQRAMTILRDRLFKRLLSPEQMAEVKRVISDPDKMIAEDILELLGVEANGLNKVEIVTQLRKRGDFSPSQAKQMEALDTDLQVIIIFLD